MPEVAHPSILEAVHDPLLCPNPSYSPADPTPVCARYVRTNIAPVRSLSTPFVPIKKPRHKAQALIFLHKIIRRVHHDICMFGTLSSRQDSGRCSPACMHARGGIASLAPCLPGPDAR